MDVRGMLYFLFLGLPTPALTVFREYYFINEAKNWNEARSYCREKFYDLATIQTADEVEEIKEMLLNSAHWGAWIGLYDDVKSWRWSLGNTSLYAQELGTWLVFNEDNYLARENCADVYQGELRDFNCEATQLSVCYDETSNSYIPVADAKTWQAAQSFCRETYTDLASIRNQQELSDVVSVVDSGQHYWVGLFRDAWKWCDQSDSSLIPWESGEPNKGHYNCGFIHESNGFVGGSCPYALPFVCSVRYGKMLKVTLKTDGSVNLNDPLVQEAILKQMEKDLRGQGLQQEFSLRWRKPAHGHTFNKTEL